jgi:hypothetical protein
MERLFSRLEPALDVPFVRRVRRNHGLEHATIHLLSNKIAGLSMVGRSDAGGFWLYGDVSTEDVEAASSQALERMRGGEHQLAIHPNCGTNLVTVAVLGTAATLVALAGSEREQYGKIARIPLIALGLLIALVFGQPLGLKLQQYVTTLGDPGDLEIVRVRRASQGSLTVHRVETRSS